MRRARKALDGDTVFRLDQATWVVVGGDVMEKDVAREGAEEGDAVSNEHRDASDDEAVNEAGGQKEKARSFRMTTGAGGGGRARARR